MDDMQRINFIEEIKPLVKIQLTNQKLDIFLQQCQSILPIFSTKDRDSLGTTYLTTTAREFLTLFAFLDENGIRTAKHFNKPLNFWSGEIAKKKALDIQTELSDSEVPAIAAMFDIVSAMQILQKKCCEHIALLNAAISRVFALHATGVANVYLTSEKATEEAGFTVSNAFWNAELPMLMLLHKAKMLTDIQIHLYDHNKKLWKNPVSLFTSDGALIPIRRRCLHPLDHKEHANRFKSNNMTADERKNWQNSMARPAISYGKLKAITMKWHAYTKRHKVIPDTNLKPV